MIGLGSDRKSLWHIKRLKKVQIQIQLQIQIPCFANALDRVGGSAMCACLSAPEARSALSPAPGISNTIESICVRIFSVFVSTFVLVFVYLFVDILLN